MYTLIICNLVNYISVKLEGSAEWLLVIINKALRKIREDYLKQTKPELTWSLQEQHRGNPTKTYEGRGGEGKGEVPGRKSIMKEGKNRTLVRSRALTVSGPELVDTVK